jgi:trimeric autotransporter adhesin
VNVFTLLHKVITLSFRVFDTESCCDRVMLYDGMDALAPLLASLSGIALTTPNYTSTQRYMYVSFTSDSSVTSIGFNATFTTSGELFGCLFI